MQILPGIDLYTCMHQHQLSQRLPVIESEQCTDEEVDKMIAQEGEQVPKKMSVARKVCSVVPSILRTPRSSGPSTNMLIKYSHVPLQLFSINRSCSTVLPGKADECCNWQEPSRTRICLPAFRPLQHTLAATGVSRQFWIR